MHLLQISFLCMLVQVRMMYVIDHQWYTIEELNNTGLFPTR